jgi:hypothetical protein
MADRLAEAATRIRQRLTECASSLVDYSRGSQSVRLLATRGQFSAPVTDQGGFPLAVHVDDFLLVASELRFEGLPVIPHTGDRITTSSGAVFEVLDIPGEGCFRHSDRFGVGLRIHTKQVS